MTSIPLFPGRTARLKQLLDSINTQTSKLYEPLLQRKQESDRIRSVLDVLSRYRFLFDLPGSLKMNIAKEQYDKVRENETRGEEMDGVRDGMCLCLVCVSCVSVHICLCCLSFMCSYVILFHPYIHTTQKVIRDYKKAKSVVVLNAKASTGIVDSKNNGKGE